MADLSNADYDALAPDEERAIASLQRLAKRWPQTLKVFSNSGSLIVCRNGIPMEQPQVAVARIFGIPNDGGDADWLEDGHDSP